SCSLFVGTNIQFVSLGDYDNDGKLDLAVSYRDGIKVFTNARTTAAAFRTNVVWRIDDTYSWPKATWGDVNRDGYLDLATGWGTVQVYTNSASGLCSSPAWESSETASVFKICWADMDNDRDLDLVLAGNGNFVSRFYRNNSICFREKAEWESGENNNVGLGNSICMGDIDNDHDMDLVVGNSGTGACAYPLRLYKNTGTNFNSSFSWESTKCTQAKCIDLGDVNNDGDLDLIVGLGSLAGSYSVILFTNNRTNFAGTPSWKCNIAGRFNYIKWADIDGDGWQDVITVDSTASRYYGFKNNSGTLSTVAFWTGSQAPGGLDVGDVDNDMDLDVVGANSSGIRCYYNVNGVLNKTASDGSEEGGQTAMILADMDQDGYIDLINSRSSEPLKMHKNLNGIFQFAANWTSGLSEPNIDLATGDIDGDGYYELAETGGDPNLVRMYKNNQGILENYPYWNGKYETDGTSDATPACSAAFGDWDNDGDLDLVVGRGYWTAAPVLVYENKYNSRIRNLPNNPPWLSQVTYSNIGNNQIRIRFYAYDNEEDTCRVKIQYSIMGKGKWTDCKNLGSYSTTGTGSWPNDLRSTSSGRVHNITWFASEDHISAPYVMVRLLVYPNHGLTGEYRSFTCGSIMYSGYTYQMLVRLKIDGFPFAKVVYPQTNEGFTRGQNIPVIGAAYDDNFDHYTLHWKTNANTWNLLQNSTTPMTPYGQLYTWNTAGYNKGNYLLRLVSYDISGQMSSNKVNVILRDVPGGAPYIKKLYPEGNSTEVSMNTPILAMFSDYMNETTLNSETIKVFDGNEYIAGNMDYNYFTKTLIFMPSQALSPNTFYKVTISSNFQNIYGVPMTVNFAWVFRTDSEMSSIITQVSPLNGKTDVEKNLASVIVKYNRNVVSGWENNLYVRSFNTNIAVGGNKRFHTNYISLENPSLRSNTLYIAKVTNTGGSGTDGTGVPASYEWFFITRDTLYPQVVSNIPGHNQQISLNGNIKVTFNKRMNDSSFMTNTFYVICSNNGKRISGTREYNISQNLITFTPSPSSLTQGKTYTATLTTGVKDFGGLPLARITNWYLRTPPPLSNPASVFPVERSTNNILKNIVVSATFGYDIDASTFNASTFYLKYFGGGTNTRVGGTLVLSNNRKLKITPDGYLSQNTWYTGVITTGLKATNGTYMTNRFKWGFRTLPPVKTNEIALFPPSSGTNVSLLPTIIAAFNTNIETGTVHSGSFYSYYITAGPVTNKVAADIYIQDLTNAVISVKSLLPQNTLIYTRLNPRVKTSLGTSLATNYTWS
ncbi:MAG: Ig-like domain-containing protein, partial [bacterium]|nr:Ig-like domain-containing protein [bacterium]